MPAWNQEYINSLVQRFIELVKNSAERIDNVVDGRVAPGTDDLPIGNAKQIRAAVLFFDIRGFSRRTGSAELVELQKTLHLLNCVIPLTMQIVFDFGGYVEKNTGDGVMAIFPATTSDADAGDSALLTAVTVFYALEHLVNPYLTRVGIPIVEARIGIDLGTVLIAKIGTHTGNSKFDRNFITAVGPAANLACKLQGLAGTNEIFVGDLVRANAVYSTQRFFVDVTPLGWTWAYSNAPTEPYRAWRFAAVRTLPAPTQ